MDLNASCVVVTGGASGLGLATASELVRAGARVVLADTRPPDPTDLSELGDAATYVAADVTDESSIARVFETAEQEYGDVRGVVHCAGRGGDRLRILDIDGRPGPLDAFAEVIRLNLVGTYNVLRLGAAAIARSTPLGGERGAIVLTGSVAGFEGQIGQTSYAAAKAGVHAMTLVAARDLARRQIRVNAIAPGVFATPLLARLPDNLRADLARSVPFPSRLGLPGEFASLAVHLLTNAYLNGETVRLDGALRMPPK